MAGTGYGRSALFACLAAGAGSTAAETGLDLDMELARERVIDGNDRVDIGSARYTLLPWWALDTWRIELEAPLLQRETRDSDSNGDGHGVAVRGIEDVLLRAARTWRAEQPVAPFIATEIKLPTGDPDAGFGTGSTDLRITPGVDFGVAFTTLSLAGGYIWSAAGALPQRHRAAATAAIDITPREWLTVLVEYNYEGVAEPGGEPLHERAWTLTLRPSPALAFNVSRVDSSADATTSNTAIGATLSW